MVIATLARSVLAGALVLLSAGCAPTLPPPAAGPGAAVPEAAVEGFLNAAAAGDYLLMGWLFGTERGPVLRRDPPAAVERRMYALATLLRNERFTLRAGARVPGRVGRAVQFEVMLRHGGREHGVPFTVVLGPGERWYVERIELEALAGRP
jgi:hypothetical protein